MCAENLPNYQAIWEQCYDLQIYLQKNDIVYSTDKPLLET